MKNIRTLQNACNAALLSLLALLFTSCASEKFLADYDNRIDFRNYRTYNFTPAADSIPLNQLQKRRIFDALSNVMNENGITWDMEPDILVHVHLMMKGRSKTNVTYGQGETVNLGSGFSTTYMDMSEYSEGSLFFDIIDTRRKQLVWTGKYTRDIRDSGPMSEKEINRIVQKVFRKFPPRPPR
jgi:hypothetical protein